MSTQSTVTFHHPIVLKDFTKPLPAGTYRLVFDEEEIAGLSFTAVRRTAIYLHLPAIADAKFSTEVVRISQNELDALVSRDNAP